MSEGQIREGRMRQPKDWIGRSETREERLDPGRAEALRVTLESRDPPLRRRRPPTGALALALLLGLRGHLPAGARRPRRARRLPAPCASAPAHVGRKSLPVARPPETWCHRPQDFTHRVDRGEAGPLRSPGFRDRAP